MARAGRSDVGREAVIGSSTRVRGRITGDGDLLVQGTVEGDVTLRGDLVVAEGASATSNIEAQAVTVNGTVEGDVRARTVVLGRSGRLRGDVTAEAFAIEEGAEINGRLEADFDLPAELTNEGARGGTGGKRR
jgi:cytoskeletal protein CcmA (bactofilin family)